MSSWLPSVMVLGLAALFAGFLARRRGSPPSNAAQRDAAARALAIAVAIQSAHFVEEAATGLPARLPELFGPSAMPSASFVVFNLAWLGIWLASVAGLRSGRRPAFFAAWFLAIAAMANAVAHPLLAVAARGYFPGLVSSPFIGGAGAWLWLRLCSATEPTSRSTGGRGLPTQQG